MKQKNESGFTLVEVIVVAAIVAILAAIGIPLYNGYIRDARQSTVDGLAETAAAAANAYWRKTGAELTDENLIEKINVYYDNTKHDIVLDGNNIKVTLKGSDPKISKSVPYK